MESGSGKSAGRCAFWYGGEHYDGKRYAAPFWSGENHRGRDFGVSNSIKSMGGATGIRSSGSGVGGA